MTLRELRQRGMLPPAKDIWMDRTGFYNFCIEAPVLDRSMLSENAQSVAKAVCAVEVLAGCERNSVHSQCWLRLKLALVLPRHRLDSHSQSGASVLGTRALASWECKP